MTAVGVSDSHSTWNPGYPRTMFDAGTDDPTLVTTSAFIAAIRGGHVTVSAGPVLTMTATTGATIARVGDTLDASGGGPVTLHVHVEAPSWSPYDTLTVYENGAVLTTQPLTPPLVGNLFLTDLDLPLSPSTDHWYVALVTGPGTLFPINPGPIYAYTNPLWIHR